jgi:hypothetical protein
VTTAQRQPPFGLEALLPFTEELFDREEENAARVLWSILRADLPARATGARFSPRDPRAPTTAPINRVLPKPDAKKSKMGFID